MNKQFVVGLLAGIILAAVISAGVFYLNKGEKNNQCPAVNQSAVANPEIQIKNLPEAAEKKETACDLKLPAIAFERPGLLTPAEKDNLQKKMIDPFFDYYNEKEIQYVSMSVEVPINVGEPYSVLAIYKDGGSTGFLFGQREKDYDYWKPECMGDCPFSGAFSAKYPQIVK